MSFLSHNEIKKNIQDGNIVIEPFREAQLNPNSYNLRLHPEMLVYKDFPLDSRGKNETLPLRVGEEGYTLYPGQLYLGRTEEWTETFNLVPGISGRSSIGRLGISVHVTAGFGDVGFCGTWTLEIFVLHPVVVYPYMEICQIFYQPLIGDGPEYHGRYMGQVHATESRFHLDKISDLG